MNFKKRLCWAIVLFAFSFAALHAQSYTGTIVGTVTDPTGALVPAAKVKVRNQGTNALRETETDSDGTFTVPLLSPGYYEISVEMTGFRRSLLRDVKLDVDQVLRADINLQLGSITQEVVVQETVPLIQTDSSSLGQVIDQGKVHELPLNERNFLSFTLLIPGAQMAAEGSQNSTQGGAVSVNGAREQSNSFLLDGVDNNDPYINQYGVLPSIEAIQEFKVQSTNYSAEFGRGGGAQINVLLKSGTNDFSGSAFEFLRNRQMDAKNYFDLPYCKPGATAGTCADIPRFDRNQFGYSLGGPIQRNRTFFFHSYEGLRLRQAMTRQATVPSRVQRTAALTAVPAGYRNPAGEAILNLYPFANVGQDLTRSNTFTASPITMGTVDQVLGKMDDQPGSHDSISGHFSFHQENRFSPYDPLNDFTNLPGYGSFTQNRGQNLGLSWTRMFNPRWLNEFRFGFNRLRARVLQEHHGQNKSKELGFPNVLTNPVNLGFPNVDLLGFDGIGEPINYPQERVHNIFHFADNMAWSRGGAHSLKMGADIRKVHLDSYLDFLSRGEWFFLGGFSGTPAVALIQLLSGLPDYAIAVKGNTESGLRTKSLSFYFQDDVRIVKRFTLNLGIRYEYNSPPTEVENRFSIPDLSSKSITCTPQPECQFIPVGESGAAYQPDRNNLAPRIGFALRPLSTTRFVLRGSYGIFYDAGILNLNIFPRMNPPFFQVYFFPNTGRSTIQTILSQSGSAVVQPNMIAPDYRDGYMQHRYFGAQYELQPNWVLDVAYSGSKGTHLTGTRDLNQPQPGIGIGQYPQFNSILLIESRASSSYNALLVRSERRFSRGIAFLAAYTFSKSIDDSSAIFGGGVDPGIPQNSLNVRAERGLSDYHAKHRVVASYIYDLPFGKGRRWLGRPTTINRLLGNWRATGIVTFQTGHPFTVNRGTTASRTAITAFGIPDRPNLVADPYVAGPVPNHPDPLCRKTRSQGGRAADQVYEAESWFNPCAFSNPGLGNFGNAGRNIMISPDYKNFDFAIMKDFRLPGDKKLVQVRAEAFNLFNHPNFDAPNRNFDSSRFGELFSANTYGNKPPRQIQLGLKFVF